MTPRGLQHPYFSTLPLPWLIAHRGGSIERPENTLPAFEHAEALGADVIETDVRLSRDGHVMVFHDADTVRITGEGGTIEARTRAEIEALDAAFHFVDEEGQPWRGRGIGIPALADVLARFPRLRFNIEAKGHEEELADRLAAVLKAAGRQETVCVGAEHGGQARRLAKRLPEFARFLPRWPALFHFVTAWGWWPDAWTSDRYDLAAVPLSYFGARVLSERVVRHFHGRGMAIQVWTVDVASDMKALLDWKADGVMSDRPTLLKKVMRR